MSDPASTYTRLRAETAAMLGVDTADMSKTEGLRLDITSLLLLEIDSLQGSILANEKVDLARLASALTMLQKLLPEKALVAPAAAADHVDQFAGANEELSNFLVRRAENIRRRDQRLEAELAANPDAARRELEARIQLAIEKYNKPIPDPAPVPNPGGGDDAARDRSVSLPEPSSLLAAAGCEPPLLISPVPPPPPPPKRIESDEERVTRVNAEPPPAHYLKQNDSPWRRHLDADGNIVAPYFNPHG
jgi:hypothetical protein